MKYEIRKREDGKVAIFDVDGNQITDWYDWIWTYGLLRGESKYFIAKKDGRLAIFNVNGKQISEWY
jgi:hypothetical protein